MYGNQTDKKKIKFLAQRNTIMKIKNYDENKKQKRLLYMYLMQSLTHDATVHECEPFDQGTSLSRSWHTSQSANS